MKHLSREGNSDSKVLQSQIDGAVALADREVGIAQTSIDALSQSTVGNRQSTISGGISVAPVNSVPAMPPPEPTSAADYTERIRAGWVPVMGLPGTPITSGFVKDLGEYNPKLEGINGIWTYQEMRRGDGQVAGTLRACKLPILSAQWQIKATPDSELKPGQTADKAKEVAHFIRENFFSGLEWQTHAGSWVTQSWKDVVRCALRMQDFGAA
jgi:hypothetical protein